MYKRILATSFALAALNLYGADFKSNIGSGKGSEWANEAFWTFKGDSKLKYPKVGDSVEIGAQEISSNFLLTLNLPKDEKNGEIILTNFSIALSDATTIFIAPEVYKFEVTGNFLKATETVTKDGKVLSTGKRGDFAIYPAYEYCKTDCIINGNLVASDFATDRTSSTFIGGYNYFGESRGKSLFENIKVGGNVELTNQILCFGARQSNAVVLGKVIFNAPVNNRQAVLLLNSDSVPNRTYKNSILKVGGLQSAEAKSGIITTKTGMQKVEDIDPLSKEGETATPNQLMNKKRIGDTFIREGTLEIIGSGGEFSGKICDNFSNNDKRGKVNITMNSEGNTQILSGELNYSGTTEVRSGTLVLNSKNGLGDFIISGGTLKYSGENLKIKNLDWSSGGIEVDFSKNKAIVLEGLANVSAMPEALDTFSFSNISARKSYALFMFKNKKDAFASFAGKKI